MQSIETMLRTVPGFAQLDGEVLERVAAVGNIAEAAQGDVLFREGTLPECLYVLLDGRVSLTGTAPDASSTVIDILGPSSSFVLANVLTDEPYQMGAEAISNSLLVRIAAEPMREVVAARPVAAMAMMRAMSAELSSMTRQVVDLKVRVATQRLGTYLLSLVGEPTALRADFRLPVTKGLLASWLGCRAENLSRAFMMLRTFGVETHGSRVVLHDISRLRSYAGACEAAQPGGDAIVRPSAAPQPPVEKVFGDAFRLRPRRPRRI
ncbi:MAG TPA: cyclic nucleotide-binding domain-containing protein [Acetobacteraceae bacterium]|jgi:CRP/FNR family transcriptional activator FtrB|nr:cyclic nucleotide-binding domain-containing protein [Acetobacteraceae bacterium]